MKNVCSILLVLSVILSSQVFAKPPKAQPAPPVPCACVAEAELFNRYAVVLKTFVPGQSNYGFNIAGIGDPADIAAFTFPSGADCSQNENSPGEIQRMPVCLGSAYPNITVATAACESLKQAMIIAQRCAAP